MLILTRRPGESLIIEFSPEIHPSTTIGEIFGSGLIEIYLLNIHGNQASIGIAAPQVLTIRRNELRARMSETVD